MTSKQPVHRIFNNRWIPLVIVVAVILIYILQGIGEEIWNRFFEGTIYGTVVMVTEDNTREPVGNVEISWSTGFGIKQCRPVLTNFKGEYRFDNDVPLGYHISMTAKYGYQHETHQSVGEIEGVNWFFGLPISTGVHKRVDFIIPYNPPIFGN